MKVSVIGQGYVGLPLSLAISKSGHEVHGIDVDTVLAEKILSGVSPIADITDQEITYALKSGKYTISSDFDALRNCEVIIICVPTPLDASQKPDLTFLVTAVKSIAQNLQSGMLIINESTVSPGTTRGLIKNLLDEACVKYDLAYSPERIDPANKDWNVTNTPKLVSGLTPGAAERALSFYRTFVKTVSLGSSLEVIETAKLLENSFRFINISFINEIAQLCSEMGIDVREVIDAAATKPYGFMPFYPSAGVGGHCIPVDPMYLASMATEIGLPAKFISLANEVNRSLASYFAKVASKLLGGLVGKKILVVGIAYKSKVSDVRETPAAPLIGELRSNGADVKWHDELVKNWNGESSEVLSPNYDLIILVNPHESIDLTGFTTAKVLDTRGGY
jgi:UDP-N-acetyl-D-glucosamine dehydrogenase